MCISCRTKFDPSRPVRELSCDSLPPSAESLFYQQSEEKILQKLVASVDDETINFIRAKEQFKASNTFPGILFSDICRFPSTAPYFHHLSHTRMAMPSSSSTCLAHHLIVCVHGLDGNSADLRLVKVYMEMALPGHHLDFLMSEVNQGDTFSSLETMTDRLVDEILTHVRHAGPAAAGHGGGPASLPVRISFVGHSLGCILIRSAIASDKLEHLVPRFHTYLALSGPHLGTLYNNSGLVNMGTALEPKFYSVLG